MKYILLGEMHSIEGLSGALIDACIHLATTDDLLIQFDIVIIISTEHKTCTVQSQCTSNSVAIYLWSHKPDRHIFSFV